jgi:hypothetical protein
MIGPTTFVMLIAATAIAMVRYAIGLQSRTNETVSLSRDVEHNAYPPCTQQRTDNCSSQQQAPWPTLHIPCPKGQYCPPSDIPRPKKQRATP